MDCKTKMQIILAKSVEESIAEAGKTATAEDFIERFIKNAIFIL